MSTEGKTVGEILRTAREARKLSVEQVNRETKISVQTVRSLEQDDFGAFPSETYLKGFVRTYAEFLGLDGNRLWAMVGTRSSTQAAGPGPSWETESGLREEKLGPPRWIRHVLVPVMLAVIIVLVILLVRERKRGPAPAVGSRVTTGATLASR
ncbi:MAG TPA: helix-turn-helix transcriptional regulator [Candidatus Krumholzibacteria bacterium]